MNIVPQTHWNASYANAVVQKALDSEPLTLLIKKYIPAAKENQQAFEIGCFPGRFLCVLGDLGYVLSGVDTTPYIVSFQNSLEVLGYQTNSFENKNYKDAQKACYDVVASFGFIEHFKNWEEVIKDHIDFLAPKGYLIITTPNFKGFFQYLYHSLFDKENLNRHVIASMSPKKWRKILESRQLEVIASGYVGHDFWNESKHYNLFYRFANKLTQCLFKFVNFVRPAHPSIASYCFIVARNK
jgi:2-polyprenyl-3-methyl-5-hydroxy-6-metoxy-1,4-benzoquinol methylase